MSRKEDILLGQFGPSYPDKKGEKVGMLNLTKEQKCYVIVIVALLSSIIAISYLVMGWAGVISYFIILTLTGKAIQNLYQVHHPQSK